MTSAANKREQELYEATVQYFEMHQPVFGGKPSGAPNSPVRFTQEAEQVAETRLRAAIDAYEGVKFTG